MKFKMLPVDKIQPNTYQPREAFDKEKLMELSESLKSVSVLQPIIVRPNGNGVYQIVSGERRWRASQMAGLKTIPTIIKNIDNKQVLVESLIENLHREDLTDFEKAKAIKLIMKQNGIKTQSELAKKLGFSNSTISQYLSILPLEKEVKKLYSNDKENRIGIHTLKSVARIPQKTVREQLMKKVMNQEMTSLEMEKVVPILNDENMDKRIKEAVMEKVIQPDVARQIFELRDEKVIRRVYKKLEEHKKFNKHFKNVVKSAQESEERSLKMQPKFMRLRELMEQDINLSTVWNFGLRENYAGDSDFHGNSPTQIVEHCVLLHTNEGDTVLDPMVGSGTSIDVCNELNRKIIAYDINPTRKEIIKNDSRKIPLDKESVDMVFIHPPYWNLVKYSNDSEDLSKVDSLNSFLNEMKKVFSECKRVLRKNKFMCVLIGDMVRKGEFMPISRKLAEIIEEAGFKDYGYAVKITSGSQSRAVKGKVLKAELVHTKNLEINHDVVMFWRKV